MAREASEYLEEIASLMNLKGENPFRVRAFEKAARALADQGDLVERARAGTLTELDGVGKGIAEILTEFLLHGSRRAADELRASVPPAVIELTRVPGLGPKKALLLFETLGITTLGELEYACRENRLIELPGFGAKLQAKLLGALAERRAHEGWYRLGDVFDAAEALTERLARAAAPGRLSEAGALRRRLETLETLDFLAECEPGADGALREKLEREVQAARGKLLEFPPVRLEFCRPARWGYALARATATPEHWAALGDPPPGDATDEAGFYAALGLPPIPPEMRETGEEVAIARAGRLGDILPWDGIPGVFHNHTTRSDGSATLEEMVVAAKSLGFKYLGISDHSQTAFYARGLKEDDLRAQEREVQEVRERHPDFRLFWGVESDILADGALDYPDAQLRRFDFVVASIHSRFQMDRATMTARVVAAVRNPATRFLGHCTGRLLLGRKGFEMDMEAVLRAAREHDVAIEINANPHRLDIDWRWGSRLRALRVPVAVNPDAHETAGLRDTRYGIAMARKALLPAGQVVNHLGADAVARWLKRA